MQTTKEMTVSSTTMKNACSSQDITKSKCNMESRTSSWNRKTTLVGKAVNSK